MSGLAALLAGHNPPNLYQWHNAAPVRDVQHAVEHAGWRFAYLDGWAVEDKDEFLQAASTALENPDAADDFETLSDCLAGMESPDGHGTVLMWDGWSPLARHDQEGFSSALKVLEGRTKDDRAGKFAVLLRGEGPSLDVPELPVKH